MAASVTLIATALSKLIGIGVAGWKAASTEGINADEMKLLKEVTGSAASFSKLFENTPDADVQYLELIVRSFGEAFKRHWGGNKALAPNVYEVQWRDYFFADQKQRKRKDELAARMATAAGQFPTHTLGGTSEREDLNFILPLIGHPLNTPYYRALFEVFSNKDLDEEDQEILLDLEGDGRREFERHFLLAYRKGLVSPLGNPVSSYIKSLQSAWPELVRTLIAQELEGWRQRHIFGNIKETAGLNHMPLEAMYVEPFARLQEKHDRWRSLPDECDKEKMTPQEEESHTPKPVLTLIREQLDKHRIVLISADFGHGKSLTARTLAWNWAASYLKEPKNSLDLVYPIFVKSGEDFLSRECDIKTGARRALCRSAAEFGLEATLDDPAFDLPPSNQRTVIVLDGLDEVVLTPSELETLFQQLKDFSSEHRRFLVLSRPAGLPSPQKREDIPCIEILPFTNQSEDTQPSQVEQWLTKWNDLRSSIADFAPITMASVRERDSRGDLLTVTQTPILLFMLAFTWDEHRKAGKEKEIVRKDIYESFFHAIARGKYEQDKDKHHPIREASQRLKKQLIKKGEMEEKGELGENDQVAQAMLWLMSRIAWEAHRLEQKQPPSQLTKSRVETILEEQLELHADDLKCVRTGLLLALQADLEGQTDRILFGHKSFREFLVGRYWQSQLRKIANTKERDRPEIEKNLLGARLLIEEDQSFAFLMEFLNSEDWEEDARKKVFEWAQDTFNDESLMKEAESFREDHRPMLREAALAIGSSLELLNFAIKANYPHVLRSILAWFWLRGNRMFVYGKRADLTGANLFGANLFGANLFGANLTGADLTGADLTGADLTGADLTGADLTGADLTRANLRGADLRGADLRRADLTRANLTQANLTGADLTGADLTRAYLRGADLRGADLRGADLRGADLTGANLTQANLTQAHLFGAHLFGAQLTGADLTRAYLRGANLTGANLVQANLTGANLTGANLTGVRYGMLTVWPKGFDFKNQGAIGPTSEEPTSEEPTSQKPTSEEPNS